MDKKGRKTERRLLYVIFFVVFSFFFLYKIISSTFIGSFFGKPWPPRYLAPIGVKVTSPETLPENCNHSTDVCWGESVAQGKVKFVATGVIDSTGREILFAYFRNTSTSFGVTGLYNYLPFYKDDGSRVLSDISGGSASEIDWVYGTRNGLIIHEKSSNNCYEQYLSGNGSVWSNRPVTCP